MAPVLLNVPCVLTVGYHMCFDTRPTWFSLMSLLMRRMSFVTLCQSISVLVNHRVHLSIHSVSHGYILLLTSCLPAHNILNRPRKRIAYCGILIVHISTCSTVLTYFFCSRSRHDRRDFEYNEGQTQIVAL